MYIFKSPFIYTEFIWLFSGGFSGFEGDVQFDRIGADYSPTFPVYQLRFLPAMMGSLVVPLVYQIAVELHMSRWSAVLAGLFIVIGRYELPPFPVPVMVLAYCKGKPSCPPCVSDQVWVTPFPVYQLRFLPAIMGSLVVPLVYQITVELHMSRWSVS